MKRLFVTHNDRVLLSIRNQGGGAIESARALGALLEVGKGEGGRERPNVEVELVAAPHDLTDAKPQEQHLHTDPIQVLDRPRLHRAGDLRLILQ